MAGATTSALVACFLLFVVLATSEGFFDEKAHRGRPRPSTRDYGGAPEAEKNPEFWNSMARNTIKDALRVQRNHNTKVAKNVVLFLGDGMGVVTVTAARILKGQMAGKPGEENVLAMESLPHVALSKTYNIDAQTPDSAATATAYLCGVKTTYATVGVDGGTDFDDCSSSKGREVQSVLDFAEAAGKSTGVVTTTRVTHATPAAAYAHAASRNWEVDRELSPEAVRNGCKDIAAQLVDDNPGIEVVLGGGRAVFHGDAYDPEYGDLPEAHGVRTDGRNLIEEWRRGKPDPQRAKYVWNAYDLNNIIPQNVEYLLGLFEPSDMKYTTDREDFPTEDDPTLSQMTRKAIEILQKNRNGFFLLVEGGRIDHGHHAGKAVKAINEAVEFDNAIQVAKDMLDTDDSLIIVTADHAHTVSLGGFGTERGSPIFGKVEPNLWGEQLVLDGNPYTSLLYGNGPGFNMSGSRENITDVNTGDKEYLQQSAVPMSIESHGAEDVAIFAGGPMAHLFHGVHEQNYIAHVMMYAACLGEYARDCDRLERATSGTARWRFNAAAVLLSVLIQLVIVWI